MPLPRVLEPEVMDTAQEASDYDAMDHTQVNARFCDDLAAAHGRRARVLDVGTGTALIPLELCRRWPDVQVWAVDLADSMLILARRNVARAGLSARVRVERRDARSMPWPSESFDAVVSNSLVHHIPEPGEVLREMWRLVGRGGCLFVRDLVRPESADRVADLVATYAPIPEVEPVQRAMHERQRSLFEASLRAALTVREAAGMLAALPAAEGAARVTSDRHWTVSCRKP
ncbi:MAG TPA: class I SAM-dependent methyltransferase [Polyangiaceae bacterium]|nr:class I SAM-dependent methyltransferase [Polyangiaceae bacterium]